MTPIGFTGMHVEVRINKTGGYAEYWTAESIIEPVKPGQRGSTGDKAA